MTAKSVRTSLFCSWRRARPRPGAASRRHPPQETTADAAKPAPEAPAGHEALPESVRLTPAAISEAGITTWKVQPVDLEHMLVLTGSVDYDENRLLQLAANVRGRATSIRVDLGARVRKGDAILEIESVELGRAREDLLRELSGLRVSARAYERAKTLVEAKAISAGEFQAREGDYLAKKAARRRRSGRCTCTASATTRSPPCGPRSSRTERSPPRTTRPGSSCGLRSTAGSSSARSRPGRCSRPCSPW